MAFEEPLSPAGAGRSAPFTYAELLEKVYEEQNPEKLSVLPKLLERYAGNEQTLFEKVCAKYLVDAEDFANKVNAAAAAAAACSLVAEADAIGGACGAGDNELSEVQREMMETLNQLDEFDDSVEVKASSHFDNVSLADMRNELSEGKPHAERVRLLKGFKEAGVPAERFREAGIPVPDLLWHAGFTPRELQMANFAAQDLKDYVGVAKIRELYPQEAAVELLRTAEELLRMRSRSRSRRRTWRASRKTSRSRTPRALLLLQNFHNSSFATAKSKMEEKQSLSFSDRQRELRWTVEMAGSHLNGVADLGRPWSERNYHPGAADLGCPGVAGTDLGDGHGPSGSGKLSADPVQAAMRRHKRFK